MEVIGAQTLNLRPKFKFVQLNFIQGTPSPLGVGRLDSPGQIARLKISGRSTP